MSIRKIVILCTSVVSASIVSGAIMSSEKRAEKLETMKTMLSAEVRPIDQNLLGAAVSPFTPGLGRIVEEEIEEEVVLTDSEILDSLSDYINPTGILKLGDEFYLVFKEKKMKVGSSMGIKFNDVDYRITITEITGSSYTIKRGGAELSLKLK